MKPRSQNIALAKLAGFTREKLDGTGDNHKGAAWTGFYWVGDKGEITQKLPDIRNDLNLLNRIERRMTEQQHKAYRMKLWVSRSDRDFLSASGPDRAENILSALKLWK